MPFREVTMIEVKEVLRLWIDGEFKRAIARRLGLDRKTVLRYVRAAVRLGLRPEDGPAALTDDRLGAVLLAVKAPPQRPHGQSWSSCIAHREFIADQLKADVRLSKVRRLLLRRGVDVPYPTLHRFAVAEVGFGRTAPTMPVADGKPGEELQVDTGWVGLLEPDLWGKRRRLRAWIFTPVVSRYRFVYPTFPESTASAIEACEAAWEFYGGIFRVLIPDNTKAIVHQADPLAAVINTTFLEYAQARGVQVDPTRAGKAKDKARVERTVQIVRDDCFAGEHLQSLDDAHRRARFWCEHEYGLRRHTRTQRLPREHFAADEKHCLLPLPSERYDLPLWADPKVARDQHAQVAKALYSLPRQFVGKTLRARADRSTVRFYLHGQPVKTHPRQPAGGRSTDPGDFPPEKAAYALRDVAFLATQASKHGEAVGHFAQGLLQGPLPWTRMRRVYALLSLCKRYGDDRVNQACALALEADMLDVRRLQRMLQLGLEAKPPAPSPPAKLIPMGRYLRPATQYALPLPSRQRPGPNHQGGQTP